MKPERILRRIESVGQPARPPARFAARASADAAPVRQVRLEGYDRALYLPEAPHQTAVFATVLETLRGTDVNAYLEVTDDRIDEIALPIVGRVLDLTERANGDVLVSLRGSASSLVLPAGVPDRDELYGRLRDGLEEARQPEPSRETAIVRRKSTGEIIYVELFTPARQAGCTEPNPQPPQDQIVRALTPVPRQRIDAVAASLASRTCDSLAIDPGCIPFAYVANYCWFRAHVMCLALADANIQSAKLWAFRGTRPLEVPTDCLPDCTTSWDYHVVTVACAEHFDLRVVDPSLFGGASVPVSTFLDLMRPAPHFVYTDASVYEHSLGARPGGPCASLLQRHRLEATAGLQLTHSFPEGPPPYAQCRT